MRDSRNPDDRKKKKGTKAEMTPEKRKHRRNSIIAVSASLGLLILILLVAFFVTPVFSKQTSGEILPGDIDSITIESGDAKIEIGTMTGSNVIRYWLTGSAAMKWKVDERSLLIKADEGSLRVSLPDSIDLGSLRIISTSKDIELSGIDAERIELLNKKDDIRIHSTDSSVITASAAGNIEWELSRSENASFSSDRDIKVKESAAEDLSLRWADRDAELKETAVKHVVAESICGKLTLDITNGISTVRMNGEDVPVRPRDHEGAAVTYTTDGGEIESSPGPVRIGD